MQAGKLHKGFSLTLSEFGESCAVCDYQPTGVSGILSISFILAMSRWLIYVIYPLCKFNVKLHNSNFIILWNINESKNGQARAIDL